MSASADQAPRRSEEHSTPQRELQDDLPVPASNSPSDALGRVPVQQGHQRFVFPDAVAFRYLEEDPTTVALERRRRLEGYEIYLVEQWACSRIHPTFIIATYTGESSHSILVGVLSVPKDETTWSSRLRVYFKAMTEYHARAKDTPLGTLMVTNLSGFPSSLTVISVPDGDIRKHREDFIVNEDLKRLGCAGRAGLNLQNPQPSTIAKFHHLFRTSESVPLYVSVMELVKLCQVSLSLYGKLPPAYADGLLCDITEKAINDWWSDIGTYIYNIEPSDGILGPSTASAIIGLLMGAFNRLKASGAPVGKDVFDIASTKRAIFHFQKSQKMQRTRRLDRQTIMRLHSVTAKAASGEGWTVPKAVKSTVAELSGKGGEMVMGFVGGRDKVGIAEVETLDIERLAQLVTGTKARWLWQGKATRSADAEMFGPFGPSGEDKIFRTDEQGNYLWTSKHRDSAWADTPSRRTDRTEDAESRTGFGRLKDAVGLPSLRSHQPRQSKEEFRPDAARGQESPDVYNEGALKPAANVKLQEARDRESFSSRPTTGGESSGFGRRPSSQQNTSQLSLQSDSALSQQTPEELESDSPVPPKGLVSGLQNDSKQLERLKERLTADSDVRVVSGVPNQAYHVRGLRRSQSSAMVVNVGPGNPRVNRVPRYLSFSAIESVVLDWAGIETAVDENNGYQKPSYAVAREEANAFLVRSKGEKISYLEEVTIPFTERQFEEVDDLDQLSQRQQDDLNTVYYERLEDYQTQKATSHDIIVDEQQALHEGLRRIEMFGAKLDYELNALDSRVEEVEDGVADFGRAVRNIESRVDELVDEETQSGPWWKRLGVFFGSARA